MEIPVAFSPTKRIAVVTGANKGIGLEICKQLASNGVMVILAARDDQRGREAVKALHDSGFSEVVFHQLDVTDPSNIDSFANFIRTQFHRLDILVNNAAISGVVIDGDALTRLNLKINELFGAKTDVVKQVLKPTYETHEECIRTNYHGTKQVTEALIPLLLQSPSAKIVNVSSTLGQLKMFSNERAKEVLSNVDDLTEEKIDDLVKEFLEDTKEGLLETKGWHLSAEGLQETKGWPASAYVVSKAVLNAYTRILAKKIPQIVEEGARGPVMQALAPAGGSGLFFDRLELSSF